MYQYEGLPSKETQGWLKDDSGYPIDWDADEILQQIRMTLDFLDKGCICKTAAKPSDAVVRKMEDHVLVVSAEGVQTCKFHACNIRKTLLKMMKKRKTEDEQEDSEDEEQQTEIICRTP